MAAALTAAMTFFAPVFFLVLEFAILPNEISNHGEAGRRQAGREAGSEAGETGETVGRVDGGETVIEVVTEDALDVRLLHQLHSTFHIVTLHSTAQLP